MAGLVLDGGIASSGKDDFGIGFEGPATSVRGSSADLVRRRRRPGGSHFQRRILPRTGVLQPRGPWALTVSSAAWTCAEWCTIVLRHRRWTITRSCGFRSRLQAGVYIHYHYQEAGTQGVGTRG